MEEAERLFSTSGAVRPIPGPYAYRGRVINRNDPLKIGRVKLQVYGVTPESDWAEVLGQPFAGAKDRGGPMVPPINAIGLVFFVAGNKEHPVFLTGGWPQGGVPSGHTVTSDGDKTVWQTERVAVEIDSRLATSEVTIRDKFGEDLVSLTLDMATKQARLKATTAVKIESVGAVEITGLSITLNGRPVAPGTKPI